MFHTDFDEAKKIWRSSTVPSVFNPNISIAHIIERSLKLNGSRIAQISDDTGEKLTFDEIHQMSIRAAQNLRRRDLISQQVIGIVAENVTHLAPVVLASIYLGCPLNVMHTLMGKQNIIRMLQLTKPAIIFCHVNAYDLFKECLGDLQMNIPVYTFNGTKGNSESVEDLFEATGIENNFIPVQVDGIKENFAILSSSGTSGQFKGIRISHAAFIAQVGKFELVKATDIFFSTSSLYWITGLISLIAGTINGATRIITVKPFSPQSQLRIMQDHQVTVVFCASFYLLDMLKSGLLAKTNLSNIKHLIVSGFKIPFSVIKEFNSYLPNGSVNNGYGLTEMSGFISIDYPSCSGRDSIGRLLKGFTVKIEDDQGNRCGIDTDGEIGFKTSHQFLGYYDNEQLTKDVMDAEGFFRTGDIGRIDKDGYLYIIDRKKDVICYDEWVFPADIEAVLLKSADIHSVCVVGVPISPMIEVPAAVVVRASESKITEDEICKLVTDNLNDVCKLRGGVYFVDSIATTLSGKLLRREAKDLAINLYKAKQNRI